MAVYTQMKDVSFGSSTPLLLLYILGVIGPAIAGIYVNKKFEVKKDFRKFLKSCYQPPKQISWYIFIVFIVLTTTLLSYIIVGGEQVAPVLSILINIPLFIIIGGLEEIGWRGVMLRELTKIISPFSSSLIVGIVWGVWHLPLFFMVGTYQYEHLNVALFIISTIALSFLLSTIYYKTNSIFLCIITHAFYNSVLDVFIINQSLFKEILILAFSLFIFFICVNKKQVHQQLLNKQLL